MADPYEALLGLLVFLSLIFQGAILFKVYGGGPTEKKETKVELKEADELKKILASADKIETFAYSKFKGDEEKAKTWLKERIKKLTGEELEAPF